MKLKRFRSGAGVAALAVLAFVLGCGSDVSGPGNGDGGGNGGGSAGPFTLFDIFMRPFVVLRAADAGPLPTPQLASYNLTAFFSGGSTKPTFTWSLDAALGQLRPKVDGLGINESTVSLLNDGTTPLGFYDISVQAMSGTKTLSLTRRIAVVENRWVKHARVLNVSLSEPAPDLVKQPTWFVNGSQDLIAYTESPTLSTVNLKSINAAARLNAPPARPRDIFLPPSEPPPNTPASADEWASFSPPALGRNEMLFTSQMDIDFDERCPNPTSCRERFPSRIWVVKQPETVLNFRARPLTFDSSFVAQGQKKWFAIDYTRPKWNPASTGPTATIAFVSALRSPQDQGNEADLWLADLMDLDGDATSDTLLNYRQLTIGVGVTSYAWHPNGQTIYFSSSGQLNKIDVASKAVETFPLTDKDPLLLGVDGVSVFWQPGENTLIAFQANSENLANLYVFDEDDDTLTKVLPFSFALSHTLWPAWHPTKKWIAYVSDYSVDAWSEDRDIPPLGFDTRFGARRTANPSIWVVKFED